MLVVGVGLGLLAATPAAAAGDFRVDEVCGWARTWAGRIHGALGMRDALDLWRCDVVERQPDRTWMIAGVYRERGRAKPMPFVARLNEPLIGVYGWCELYMQPPYKAETHPSRPCGPPLVPPPARPPARDLGPPA